MRLLAAILLALALTASARATSYYFLDWTSPVPIQVTSITVTGGSLTSATSDGTSGEVWASADRECLTITLEGLTAAGAGVRMVQTWDAGCYRAWVPVVSTR